MQKGKSYFIKELLQAFNLASDMIRVTWYYAAIFVLAGASFTDLRRLQRRLVSGQMSAIESNVCWKVCFTFRAISLDKLCEMRSGPVFLHLEARDGTGWIKVTHD